MKQYLPISVLFALTSLFLFGCAPGAITPSPIYDDSEGLSTGPYPSSTRAGHFDQDGFYISAGPVGLGLEVSRGPWRGILYGSHLGAAGRVSWSQQSVGASLDMAYSGYSVWRSVDSDNDGKPDTEKEFFIRTLGAAVDATYYFDMPTDIGSAYIGPRGRLYFACQQENNSPYNCNRYGLLPGGVLGINVPLSFISERLTMGMEGSVFLVIPGVTDRDRFSVFSPFSITLSYRF